MELHVRGTEDGAPRESAYRLMGQMGGGGRGAGSALQTSFPPAGVSTRPTFLIKMPEGQVGRGFRTMAEMLCLVLG